jgi:hypothetical protein
VAVTTGRETVAASESTSRIGERRIATTVPL